MSRCSQCNAAAFQLVEPKERVRPLVPPHVYDLVSTEQTFARVVSFMTLFNVFE